MRKRQYLILVALVAVSGFMGGLVASRAFNAQPAMAQEGDVIVAQQLALVDANNDLKAMISAKDGPPGIALYDAKGNARGIFSLSDNGEPVLTLQDAGAKAKILLGATDEGGAELLMKDAGGNYVLKKP